MRGQANRAFSRKRSYGKTVRRSGASIQGTMANYVTTVISERMAEREKARVVERALDLYTNDSMGHGVVEGGLIETVGIGLTPSFTPRAEWLGKDTAWAELFEQRANQMFNRWGLGVHLWCDAQRRLNFYALQALQYFQWKIFGIGLAQVVVRSDALRPLGLALLPVCPTRLGTPSDATGEVFDGIEIGKYGEPTHAFIRKPDRPVGNTTDCYDRVAIRDAKTGLPKLLFTCDVRNVAEYKQDSIYATLIKTLRDANDMSDAVLVGAVVRNLYVGFINAVGQGAMGANKNLDIEDRIIQTDNGTILQGLKGESMDWFSHTAAPQNLTDLTSMIHDRIGVGTVRGQENILRKYQASYSASKASFEKAEEVAAYEHTILNRAFNAPVMAWMLYEMCLRSLLPVTSSEHFIANIDAYYSAEFLPQPMRQIDRKKAAEADVIGLNSNTTSLKDVFGRDGKDWRVETEQRAKELKHLQDLEEKYGVSLRPPVKETGSEGTANSEEEDES